MDCIERNLKKRIVVHSDLGIEIAVVNRTFVKLNADLFLLWLCPHRYLYLYIVIWTKLEAVDVLVAILSAFCRYETWRLYRVWERA